MLGDYVYFDDFYTKSSGYKFYPSWGVPSCAQGCQYKWIGDGFCDMNWYFDSL